MKDKVAIVAVLIMLAGCATNSDIEKLNARVDNLDVKIEKVKEIALDSQDMSRQAVQHAATAEELSLETVKLIEAYSEKLEARLDKLFKLIQRK